MMSNCNLGPMDAINENNENLQLPAGHLAKWRALMGFRAGVDMERQNLALKMKCMEAEQGMSFGNPLSPKNQGGTKRPSFSFAQDSDEEFIQKSAKRAKVTHDAMLLAAASAGGMRANPLLGAHLQPQLPLSSVSPLLLNPALLTAGYASAAAAQQLMISQALANNTNGVNPLVQQQINTLINAELTRLAGADADPATSAFTSSTAPKGDPIGVSPTSAASSSSTAADCTDNIACLNLGSEFLPATTQSTRLCDCGMALCHEIGYPHRGSIPFTRETVNQWCKTLDITDADRLLQIKENPENFRLAYWHFREEHHTINELTGQLTVWTNSEAMPDAHLQTFVDEYRRVSPKQVEEAPRQPSQRMIALHNDWVQCRRAPTLEP